MNLILLFLFSVWFLYCIWRDVLLIREFFLLFGKGLWVVLILWWGDFLLLLFLEELDFMEINFVFILYWEDEFEYIFLELFIWVIGLFMFLLLFLLLFFLMFFIFKYSLDEDWDGFKLCVFLFEFVIFCKCELFWILFFLKFVFFFLEEELEVFVILWYKIFLVGLCDGFRFLM